MSTEPLPFTPIIIIGAGRSGTNILRDTLTALDGFDTWACDEINPIWRHGNLMWPSDEIPPERATPAISSFIRSQFIKLWKSAGKPSFIVEKTCANTLRVPFVKAVFPEARFINIVRNGYDVIASAEKRWQGDFELPKAKYFIAKARYTPIRDLPIYGSRFLGARLKLNSGKAEHLGVWGPRFEGMSDYKDLPLIDLCALQWINCIERADEAFATTPKTEVAAIRYEALMNEPLEVMSDLLGQIAPELSLNNAAIENAIHQIRPPSCGKYDAVAKRLSPEVHGRLCALLKSKGYEANH